jgi:hypothetical protein
MLQHAQQRVRQSGQVFPGEQVMMLSGYTVEAGATACQVSPIRAIALRVVARAKK